MRPSIAAIACLLVVAVLGTLGANAKPPKGQVTITDSPKVITFGQQATISGKLTGPKMSGVSVQLQQQQAPYTGGFHNFLTTTTNAQGQYSFTVGPLLNTKYRVMAKAGPTVTSAEITLPVRFKVTLRLSDTTPTAGQRVRFSGICAPKHNGALVYIQRRSATGAWHTVRRTTLKDTTGDRSKYSRRIRISRTGTFRARVLHDTLHATGTSRAKTAHVS